MNTTDDTPSLGTSPGPLAPDPDDESPAQGRSLRRSTRWCVVLAFILALLIMACGQESPSTPKPDLSNYCTTTPKPLTCK